MCSTCAQCPRCQRGSAAIPRALLGLPSLPLQPAFPNAHLKHARGRGRRKVAVEAGVKPQGTPGALVVITAAAALRRRAEAGAGAHGIELGGSTHEALVCGVQVL
jgi:hypothetical protein